MEARAESFSKAVYDKSKCSYELCWIHRWYECRCGLSQGCIQQFVVRIGHKRKHALKYQAINKPNGMIVYAHRPVEGWRHH